MLLYEVLETSKGRYTIRCTTHSVTVFKES